MLKIFISYKRNIEPDTPVAISVYEALKSDHHDVFIDTTILVGEKWGPRIQKEISDSDYLIIFLSENSVNSEMVIGEVETAHHHSKVYGNPTILPVRLAYDQALNYPLSAYLNQIQWAIWEKEDDTSRLITELKRAIEGGKLRGAAPTAIRIDEGTAPTAFANIPRDLGSPEGSMPHQSPFYVERETDHEAIQALCDLRGVTIPIKGPRQMGKSSLLNRLMVEGCKQEMRSAFIDFQLLEQNVIENPEIFYRQFCSQLALEFELDDFTEKAWQNPLGPVQKTTNYVSRYILKTIPDVPILLAMDEVDRMFSSPFRSDFFSMLRNWHERRARPQNDDWKRLNLALVTSTEPYQLIANMNQSPFNVGTVITLSDFNLDQVEELNQRHGNPLQHEELLKLTELLNGHPYLTRKALYLLASKRITFRQLMSTACEDGGPFGDHLRYHLYRISNSPELKAGMLGAIKHKHISDETVIFRLRGAGLVHRVRKYEVPRNPLYAEYFEQRLNR